MSLTSGLYQIYWTMEHAIAPRAQYAPIEYEKVLDQHIATGVRWLDLGCGRRVLPPWRADAERALVGRCKSLVGTDADLASLRDNRILQQRCQSAARDLPFRDACFDVVTANMVVEHLRHPDDELREVWRVLAPAGAMLFHTPNRWAFPTVLVRSFPLALKRAAALALERRHPKDVFPAYYRANDASTVKKLASAIGFEVVDLRLVSSHALFALVPPLAALELLWIRHLLATRREAARSNMIVTLRKVARLAQS